MKILHNGFRFSIILGRWVTKLPYSDAGIAGIFLFSRYPGASKTDIMGERPFE